MIILSTIMIMIMIMITIGSISIIEKTIAISFPCWLRYLLQRFAWYNNGGDGEASHICEACFSAHLLATTIERVGVWRLPGEGQGAIGRFDVTGRTLWTMLP